MSFLAAAGWTLLVGVVFELVLGFTEAVHPGAASDLVSITTSRLIAYSAVFFVMLRVHEPEASIRSVLALRRVPVLAVLLALVVGAGLSPLGMWIESQLALRMPPTSAELEALDRLFASPTLARKIGLIASFSVLLPIADELYFRGALFTQLKRGRPAQLVFVATAAYDALPLVSSPRDLPSMFVAVLAIAWIRAATGSVVPAAAARAAFFAVQVVPLALGREAHFGAPVIAAGAALSALSLAGIGLMSRRHPALEAARAEDA